MPSPASDTSTYDGTVTRLIETKSGDLLLFYHQSDIGHTAPDGRIVLRRSTDRGEMWTESRIIHDESDRDVLWVLQVLISTDEGQTWDRHVSTAESPDGRQRCEPVPCAITESKLLVFGRDNATGDFFALRSADGGLARRAPVFFNPTNSGGEPITCCCQRVVVWF
jgi:hypothetical protein